MNTESTQDTPETSSTSSTKPRRIWLIFVGILLVGTYAALFIPAIAGQYLNPMSGYASLIWNGLFFYLWWKQKGRKGWHGTLLGIFVGFLAFVLAAFVGGLVRHA